MTHDVRRSDFTSLVDAEAPVRSIGSGFEFTEGPLWHPVEHYLLFSDMPGDVRRRWDETGGVCEVARPSNKCNGMTYDAELNLIICEHSSPSCAGRERSVAVRCAARDPGPIPRGGMPPPHPVCASPRWRPRAAPATQQPAADSPSTRCARPLSRTLVSPHGCESSGFPGLFPQRRH